MNTVARASADGQPVSRRTSRYFDKTNGTLSSSAMCRYTTFHRLYDASVRKLCTDHGEAAKQVTASVTVTVTF